MKYPIKILCALLSFGLGGVALASDEARSNSLSVPFEFGSTHFDPNPFAIEMLKLAPHSAMVIVNGRTSNMTFSKNDELIALKRAVSARNYLISIGVSPLKILINYASAADYAVDNTSTAGQEINQRVDIELIQVYPPVIRAASPSPALSVWPDSNTFSGSIEPGNKEGAEGLTVEEEKPVAEDASQSWNPVVPVIPETVDGWQVVR